MNERRGWALRTGLPSRHTARAAMHVASVIDAHGSLAADAAESYWHRATGGQHPPADLALGQALLIDVGLLIGDRDILRPTTELLELLEGTVDDALVDLVARAVAATPDTQLDEQALIDLVPDAERRENLLLQLAQRFDDAVRTAVGTAGEQLVVTKARAELLGLDRPDLAREVRRVSRVSDQLGYDVVAPCLQDSPRRLEVKATTRPPTDGAEVFLTRNEARVGEADPAWKLVLCHVTDLEPAIGEVVGWWSYADLSERLPVDVHGGVWEQARVSLPVDDMRSGLPSAVT